MNNFFNLSDFDLGFIACFGFLFGSSLLIVVSLYLIDYFNDFNEMRRLYLKDKEKKLKRK